MSKTYRRNKSFRPKNKDFKKFKESDKFKKWDSKPKHHLPLESEIDTNTDE